MSAGSPKSVPTDCAARAGAAAAKILSDFRERLRRAFAEADQPIHAAVVRRHTLRERAAAREKRTTLLMVQLRLACEDGDDRLACRLAREMELLTAMPGPAPSLLEQAERDVEAHSRFLRYRRAALRAAAFRRLRAATDWSPAEVRQALEEEIAALHREQAEESVARVRERIRELETGSLPWLFDPRGNPMSEMDFPSRFWQPVPEREG
jgi:hypothetical protein